MGADRVITGYSLLLDRCGLSQSEAARFHHVRIDTVRLWSTGRTRVPAGIVAELRELYKRVDRAAADAVAAARAVDTNPIELVLARDDAAAQSLGWPCVGVHAAMLGLVAARLSLPVLVR